MNWINKFHLGHSLDLLSQMPSEFVSCVVTSPPYWGLRDYNAEPVIWDGDKNCKHDFSIETKAGDIRFRGKNSIVGNERNPKIWEGNGKGNFCTKCSAWHGSLGLEPTFELYIKHLCDIFDGVKRVLRKDGICWVVIGDTYAGGGGRQGPQTQIPHNPKKEGYRRNEPCKQATILTKPKSNMPSKSLLDIPYRFSIEMTNRGWIKRNTIIWYKTNSMPQSAKDRFTVDFEYVFYFTKSRKTLFWTNEKSLKCVGEHPPGIKGIEGVDWEWRLIGADYEDYDTKISPEDAEKYSSLKARKYRRKGWRKVSLWTGHDYWFEQQFEEYTKSLDRWGGDILKADNKSDWDKGTGQATYRTRDMRPNSQGRNKRCVWTIPTLPFPEAHFAVYPEKLIEIPIKAGCPEFICKKCGKARVKIYRREIPPESCYTESVKPKGIQPCSKGGGMGQKLQNWYNGHSAVEVGYSDCGCGAGFEPGVTLDPFIGAGTTAAVALKQGKRFIGLDIKQEYLNMARKRIIKIQPKLF